MSPHVIALSVWLFSTISVVPPGLDIDFMQALRGADGCGSCRNCHYDGQRVDECAHFFKNDPCETNRCIANYLLEDTCDPATTQDCSAVLNPDKVWLAQYLRTDVNCSTDNPDEWQVFVIHYYMENGECARKENTVRCQKSVNDCNGTLIDTYYALGAIDCQ